MKYCRWILPVVILILCWSTALAGTELPSPLLATHRENGVLRAGQGWATEVNGLKVAYFKGTPEEIGAQMYHLIVAPQEKEMLEAFDKLKRLNLTGRFWIRLFKNFYAGWKFIPNFKRFTPPEYLRELQGFVWAASRGKDTDINELIMSNAWQDIGLVYGGCSFFAAWNRSTVNGDMIIGRNLDYSVLKDIAKYQSLNFYHPEQGLKFVTLNYPSMVGMMQGMNEKGMVIAMTYSTAVQEELTVSGIPFTIMLRHALQYGGNLDQIIHIIKNSPRTVGLNILAADAVNQEAVVIEVTAHRMAVRHNSEFIYAANRFSSESLKAYQTDGWLSSALRESRFDTLKKLWEGKYDIHRAADTMRDKNDPAVSGSGFLPGIENGATIASILFNPSRLEVWASNKGGEWAPDGSYIGFSAARIWAVGQPEPPLGVIPATEETGYLLEWRQVIKAEHNPIPEDILKTMEPIVQKHPEAELPLFLLGQSYLRTNRLDRARDVLNQMVQLPQIAEPYYLLPAYFYLGAIYDTLGHREKALEHYRSGVQIKIPDLYQEHFYQKACKTGLKHPLAVNSNGVIVRAGKENRQ